MKQIWVLFLAISLLMPTIVVAADAIEGTVQGYNCVTQGTCVKSSEDPVVNTEFTFVVVTPDNKFYFIPNVPRAVLAYRDTERIRVSGELDSKYNKITAQRVDIIRNDKWRLVWNRDSEFNPIPDDYR